MSNLFRRIEKAFQTSGLRLTTQRHAVLKFLAKHSGVHSTAEEICEALNRHNPRASRATVYNNLRSLTKAGLVREVVSEGKAARFDANLDRHHHFVCERCGRLEDVEWFDMPLKAGRTALDGRDVISYEVLFRGECAACRESGEGGTKR